MRKLLVVLAVAWGAVVIYRGVTEGLPTSPQDGRAWGSVAAFGVAIAMGLAGGFFPAVRAARMNLVQAIRGG